MKYETIDFEIAEKIITISQRLKYPSVIFVGKNGIGKTTMLDYHSKKTSHNFLTSRLDMGGIETKQTIDYFTKNDINNIFLIDLERILSRRDYIVTSALDSIADSIDPVRAKNITYQNRENITLVIPRLNYLCATTPQGFNRLKGKPSAFEFLTRMTIFFIDDDEFTPKFNYPSEIDMPLLQTEYKLTNIRHTNMYNHIISGLTALGHNSYVPVYFWEIDLEGNGRLSTPYGYLPTIRGRVPLKKEDYLLMQEIKKVQKFEAEVKSRLGIDVFLPKIGDN